MPLLAIVGLVIAIVALAAIASVVLPFARERLLRDFPNDPD